MNQKSLFCVVVLSLMFIAANGLRIAHQQEETVELSPAETKFEEWIATNPVFVEADAKQTEISPEDAASVKQYFTDNIDVLDGLIYQGDQNVIACKNALSDQLKAQLDQKFLDKMDFTKIFIQGGQKTLTEDQFQGIFDEVVADVNYSDFITCIVPETPETPETPEAPAQ